MNGQVDYLVGNSPDELARGLNDLTVPYVLLAIVPQGTRHVAYFVKTKSDSKQKLKIIKKEVS